MEALERLKIADFLSFVLLRDRMMKSAISRMPSGASRAFAAKRFFGEEGFGKHLFTGVNAAPYLAKQGIKLLPLCDPRRLTKCCTTSRLFCTRAFRFHP